MTKKFPQKSTQPRKNLKFWMKIWWKIKNRPTIGDFEKKTEVLNENLKIVLPMGLLKKKIDKKSRPPTSPNV